MLTVTKKSGLPLENMTTSVRIVEMNEKQARQLASEIRDASRGVYAKVNGWQTNGEKRYVVHVTHKDLDGEPRRIPYTLSSPE